MSNTTFETATEPSHTDKRHLVLTSQIVAAYVTRNPIDFSQLPEVIRAVYQALHAEPNAATATTGTGPANSESARSLQSRIKQSIGDDYLICLEDGERVTMLKRYLRVRYNLTPEEYRIKWGLPYDYPMVAPSYAAMRSELAKNSGLGQKVGSKLFQAALGQSARKSPGRPRKRKF